jgi:alanine or glycine:cation symporter, AGCS family
MMEIANNIVSTISNYLWGYVLIVLLVGTGIFLTIRMRGIQFIGLKHGFKLIRGIYDKTDEEGDLSHFKALTTALSATVGIGNIAGVALAIRYGGPGALFWMWVTAVVGMATKYVSCMLAVKYRQVNPDGTISGGPMYFIEMGLGENWKGLAVAFAIFAGVGAFGAGCMAQAGELARAVLSLFPQISSPVAGTDIDLANVGVGLVMAVGVGAVIIGGIKRIGNVTSFLVPVMAVFYCAAALLIILLNIKGLPGAITLVVTDAFTGTAATGGFLGAGFILALRMGVKRGLFSNESGQGSAPMAHATAKTKYPAREGYVALLGPFLDTIIICSLTGLVIILTDAWRLEGDINGADLTAQAFQIGLGSLHNVALQAQIGRILVTVAVVLFAFSTAVSWSYYQERCVGYLFGLDAIIPSKYVFCFFIIVGATIKIDLVWNFCDVLNGAMAVPNLIALILLSGVAWRETKNYQQMIPGFDEEIRNDK